MLRALNGQSADAIVNELTALKKPPRKHSGMRTTDRLRTEGTANLIAATTALGATRFVTQSFILGYGYRDHGAQLLDEDAPFGQPAGDRSDPHVAAMLSTEQQAYTTPVGIALRYGLLYGGDTEQMRVLLAKRQVPVAAGGLLGWVHHHDAVAATVAAVERGRAGQAYNIVDDEPASWQQVFTAMAESLGASSPRGSPCWLFRLVAPYVATFAVDSSMRVANTKAKRELGWSPRFRTFREGVAAMARPTEHEEPAESTQ